MQTQQERAAVVVFFIFAIIIFAWTVLNFNMAHAKSVILDSGTVLDGGIYDGSLGDPDLDSPLDASSSDPLEGLIDTQEELEEIELRQQYEKERELTAEHLYKSIMNHMVFCKRPGDNKLMLIRSCRSAEPLGCEDRIKTFVGYILDAAEKYKLDPYLLAAMAYNESRFNPYAVGPTVGSKGIFQINPRSKRGRQSKFVKSPDYRTACMRKSGNCQKVIVEMGADHIKKSVKYCGSLPAGLSQYNTGKCGIRRLYVRNTMRVVNSLKAGHKPMRWCGRDSMVGE